MRVLSVAKRYSRQPEEKLITISRIKEASCPYRYFKEYVEEPKGEKAFVSIEAGIGKFFHSYVESHFRRIMARDGIVNYHDVLDVGELVRAFRLSFLWEGRLREPYKIVRDTYGLGDFVQRLEGVGENFNDFLTTRLLGHKIFATEGQLQIRADSFYIRGKHDLITQEPAGAFALWDWKTGRVPDPKYHDDFINQKVQLGIYATWMKYQFWTSAIRGTAVFLRDGCHELSEVFTPAVEREVLEYLRDWRSRLNEMTSYPPIPGNLCDWCGWNPCCPAYAERTRIVVPHVVRRDPGTKQVTRSSGGKCFVATCVFENTWTPEVTCLRTYRDEVLGRFPFGQALMSAYEAVGPIAASILQNTPLGKKTIRAVLRVVVVPMVQRRLRRLARERDDS